MIIIDRQELLQYDKGLVCRLVRPYKLPRKRQIIQNENGIKIEKATQSTKYQKYF